MAGLPPVPPALAENAIHRAQQTVLEDQGRIYLEDLDFQGKPCSTATEWAKKLAEWVFPREDQASWRGRFMERFAVLPDMVFDFLTETGTEVTARVKIDDDSKTVVEGQLWNEESLPSETIMYGLVVCDRVFSRDAGRVTAESLLEAFATNPLTLQIGGKATVGRGRVRCVFTPVAGGAP